MKTLWNVLIMASCVLGAYNALRLFMTQESRVAIFLGLNIGSIIIFAIARNKETKG